MVKPGTGEPGIPSPLLNLMLPSFIGPDVLPFLQRLKQRKIVQWAIGYFAGAWLVLAVFDMVAEQSLWPAWIRQASTVTVLFGGGRLRVIACIEEPQLIAKILGHVRARDEATSIEVRAPPGRLEAVFKLV